MNEVVPEHRLLFCLDEIDVVFFLPLQDALPLPEKLILPTYETIHPDKVREILGSGLDFVAMPADGSSGGDGQVIDVDTVDQWFYFSMLSSSLMVHSVETDVWARTALDAAYVTLAAQFTSATTGEMPDLSTLGAQPASHDDDGDPRPRDLGAGLVTVIEAVVPLHLVGDPPVLSDEFLDISSPATREGPLPYRSVTRRNLISRLGSALDAAITDIRTYQRSYYATTGDPITLLTRERLPAFVPFILRNKAPTEDPDSDWEHGIARVNDNLRHIIAPEELSEDRVEYMFMASGEVERSGPFVSFLDLHREAKAALRRQGDTRLSAIMCGVAAESLLDDVLLCMLWEEAKRPEEVAKPWDPSLTRRVKREYAPRLGGQWDLQRSNPITHWHDDVAQLRHRVAHSAYLPTRGEATLASSRLNELLTYLVDRLLERRRLAQYPRTAFMLAGNHGLETRKIRSRELETLQADDKQPNWRQTFGRWRDAVTRCRRDSERPRIPNTTDALKIAVQQPDNSMSWCLFDESQYLAAPAKVDIKDFPATTQRSLTTCFETLREKAPGAPESVRAVTEKAVPVEVTGEWREAYHFLSRQSVMVDGSDIDPWQ